MAKLKIIPEFEDIIRQYGIPIVGRKPDKWLKKSGKTTYRGKPAFRKKILGSKEIIRTFDTEMEAAKFDREFRMYIEQKLKGNIADLEESIAARDIGSMWTIQDAHDYCEQHVWKVNGTDGGRSSIRASQDCLRLLRDYSGKHDIYLDELTPDYLDEINLYWEELGHSKSTRHVRFVRMNKWFTEAHRKGKATIQYSKPQKPKGMKSRHYVISEEKEEVIFDELEKAEGLGYAYTFRLLMRTGVRIGELFEVQNKRFFTISAEDSDDGVEEHLVSFVTLKQGKDAEVNGEKPRRDIHIEDDALEAFMYFYNPDAPEDVVVNISRQKFSSAFAAIRNKFWPTHSGLVPHACRHSACTRLGLAGASVFEIMAFSGHKTIAMVQHYTEAAQRTSRKLARSLSKAVGLRVV